MVFSDTSTKTGIVEDIDFLLGGTDATAYPLVDKARNVNKHFDRVVTLILQVDDSWKWDDANQTDLPVSAVNIVSGTSSYTVATYLKILRVDILDSNGNGINLIPFSESNIRGTSLDEFQSTSGTPNYYRLLGNKIILYSTPNYAYTAGLKIHYQRVQAAFASTDTTKEPGFAPIFHRYLSYGAAMDYCIAKGITDRIPYFQNEMAKMEMAIKDFYSKRFTDKKHRITVGNVLRRRYAESDKQIND